MTATTNIDIEQDIKAISVLRKGMARTPAVKRTIAFSGMISIIVAIGRLAVPVLVQQVIDRGLLGDSGYRPSLILTLSGVTLCVILVVAILTPLAEIAMVNGAQESLYQLRRQAFAHIHQLSLNQHSTHQRGALLARVTSDVETVSRFVEWGAITWAMNGSVIIGAFIVMAIYSWQLALLALVAFVPVFVVMKWVRSRMARAHDERRTAIGELLGAFSESLSGAEVVRAYNAQHRTQRRLDHVSETRYRKGLRANLYMSCVFVVGDLVGAVMLALVLIVGVTQREALDLSSGALVAILFLITLLMSPISELGETINNAQEAVAGWRKVLDLLDQPIEDLDPHDGASLPEGPLSFEAAKVNFDYGDGVPILRDVSVAIPAGVRVAIVGETGSGKSTFARLLCRLADPVDGVISIGGADLREVSGASRQSAVRMVPQDGFLFDTTIRENISFGRVGAVDADIDRAIELLNLGVWVEGLPLGLETPVGERGSSLSVGERQLVSFARAAVADPGILILDEATSSVDPQTDLQLTRARDRFAAGRTIVSIAHRLSTAESADIVLVFHDGKLIEQGSHDDLVGLGGRYADLFAAWTADATNRP
jgi:ATP-binding cassette subfamily B protein